MITVGRSPSAIGDLSAISRPRARLRVQPAELVLTMARMAALALLSLRENGFHNGAGGNTSQVPPCGSRTAAEDFEEPAIFTKGGRHE